MTAEPPLVTVLIPARNERGAIEACLRAVLSQDWPLDHLEVLVVDGASADGTAQAAKAVLNRAAARGEVLANPGATTPSNLNVGLAAATGTYLCRVDARSLIPPAYVRTCVATLAERDDVVVVGGSQVAVPPGPGEGGLGIARALNNRWGTGLSRHRRDRASGPAETVYLGAFRTADLRAAGGWDEAFPTNQDFELNRRLGRSGVVWFHSGLEVGYVPRSDLVSLFRQYHRFGRAKVRYWRLTGDRPRPRQFVLLTAPVAGAALAVVALRRAPRLLLPLLAGALAGAAAVERSGAGAPRSGPAGHAVAVAGLFVIATGWLSGVLRATLHRP